MADSYSVRAILSAQDKNFTSTLKSALGFTGKLQQKVSGFAFGMLTGAGQQAFAMLTSSASDFVGELNSSSAAWKTFEGNMKVLGKTDDEINTVRGTLEKYATETIYSASDMATTYSQLAAVGVKSADKLVTGFGGLAAAAENPQQAMKTLSQQATQMAGKPYVAWQDFKLMLEQTPAGLAKVAEHMGMSTKELVKAVQDGTVKTEDFFEAVQKVGNEDFGDLARQYKTLGQAMDGAKETLSNKLLPAYEKFQEKGISAVSSLINKMDELDAQQIAKNFEKWLGKAGKYWDALKVSFKGTWTAIKDAGGALKKSIQEITGAFGSTKNLDKFSNAMDWVASAIKKVAGFIEKHSDQIAWLITNLPKIWLAMKGFQIAKTVAPFVTTFAKGITALTGKGIGGIAAKLFGISTAEKVTGDAAKISANHVIAYAKAFLLLSAGVLLIAAGLALLAASAIKLASAGPLAIGVMAGLVIALVGLGVGMAFMLKTLAPMAGQMTKVGVAFLALGAAVVLIAAGFALLAFTAISLANAGGPAIACMFGMIAAIALLAVGAALLGPALNVGAMGFLAFGAAILLVGAGILLASAGMALLATQLPIIAMFGMQAALAIAALGAGMIVFAAGALLAGAALIVLGAGLTVAAAGLLLVGVAALVAAAGITAMAAGTVLLGAALMITAVSVTLLAGMLPSAAAGALMCVGAFAAMLGMAVALGAALLLMVVPLGLVGGLGLLAAAGMLAFGIGMMTGAVSTLLMAAALKAVNSSLKTIAKNAKATQKSLKSMRSAVKVVGSGLDALGNKAKSAMNKLKSAFDNTAKKAQSAGKKTGTGFANGMKGGLNNAVSYAKSASNKVISALNKTVPKAKTAGSQTGKGYAQGIKSGLNSAKAAAASASSAVNSRLRSGRSGAYSAGAYISQGFAAGMRSCLGSIKSAANQIAAAAEKAIRAKAKIHSPSRVTMALGEYWGEGFANGIESMYRAVSRVSESMVSIPNIATPNMAMAYSGELSEDYSYTNGGEYKFVIPFSIDGREFARAEAGYMQDELNRRETRGNRKRGKL